MYAYETSDECLEEFGHDEKGQARFDLKRYVLALKRKAKKKAKR